MCHEKPFRFSRHRGLDDPGPDANQFCVFLRMLEEIELTSCVACLETHRPPPV
jgi:hypothetical protein